jgi:hypothetical protein
MPQLRQTEINTLEEAFDTGQEAGYVLNFSDHTFATYFDEEFQIDIDSGKYKTNGTSKGKRLRAFMTMEPSDTVARVLRSLWILGQRLLHDEVLLIIRSYPTDIFRSCISWKVIWEQPARMR